MAGRTFAAEEGDLLGVLEQARVSEAQLAWVRGDRSARGATKTRRTQKGRRTLKLGRLGCKLAKGRRDGLHCRFARKREVGVSRRPQLRAPTATKGQKLTKGAAALDEHGQSDEALGADIFRQLHAEQHQVEHGLGNVGVQAGEVRGEVVDLARARRRGRRRVSRPRKGWQECAPTAAHVDDNHLVWVLDAVVEIGCRGTGRVVARQSASVAGTRQRAGTHRACRRPPCPPRPPRRGTCP